MITINTKENIICWNLYSDVDISQIFDAINETNMITPNVTNLKILQIDNDSINKIRLIEHVKISFFARKYLKQYSKVKIAFVINKPVNVAIAILAMKTLSGGKLLAKVFSEKENAKEWLINMN